MNFIMAKTKALFLSDIHLSSQERYNDTKFPCNYKPNIHTPRLTNFLRKYLGQNKSSLKDIVLLGDIFDTWACPAQKTPPTVEEIVLSNPEVITTYFDDLLEAVFTPQNLFSSMIEGLAEKAGLSDTEEIVLSDTKTISINKV